MVSKFSGLRSVLTPYLSRKDQLPSLIIPNYINYAALKLKWRAPSYSDWRGTTGSGKNLLCDYLFYLDFGIPVFSNMFGTPSTHFKYRRMFYRFKLNESKCQDTVNYHFIDMKLCTFYIDLYKYGIESNNKWRVKQI